jgi:hypothetical protein
VGIVTAESNGYIVLVTCPLKKLKRFHRSRYLSSQKIEMEIVTIFTNYVTVSVTM